MNDIKILTAESDACQHLCKKDRRLAKVISLVGDISYHVHEDPFDFLVHEIIEQMLSVKAGNKIYSRLVDLCGEITPDAILSKDSSALRATGMSNAKVEYIQILAKAIKEEALSFQALTSMTDLEVIKTLTRLRGIGTWTAKMYLIFVLDRPDVLPFEDGAFMQSYKWLYKSEDYSPKAIQAKCKKWKPYSSIASRYLYRVLDMGLTKEEFHLFK